MALVDTLSTPAAEIFVPDRRPEDEALARTTDLVVVAHPDDAEFVAIAPILDAYDDPALFVSVCVCTDGARSPRAGPYAAVPDSQMAEIRRREQRKAGVLGRYGSVVALAHTSDGIASNPDLRSDLSRVVGATRPTRVWTHDLADLHPTHVAVGLAAVRTCRSLTADRRPDRLFGCAGWRSLDWVPEEHLVRFDVSHHSDLATALLGVFDSQITGGKRYDLAATGRRTADATLSTHTRPDDAEQLVLALDMTPLLDPSSDVKSWLGGIVERFGQEILDGLDR